MNVKMADDDDFSLDTNLDNLPVIGLHQNKPFDESEAVLSEEEVLSIAEQPPQPQVSKESTMPEQMKGIMYSGMMRMQQRRAKSSPDADDSDLETTTSDDNDLDVDDEDDNDADSNLTIDDKSTDLIVPYCAEHYKSLEVSPDIKELFKMITNFVPRTPELEFCFKPFLPDYIPAIGDIDPGFTIPRPDGKEDSLGVTVLKEPCARQSDPSVLMLSLRMHSKSFNKPADEMVKTVVADDKVLEHWIDGVTALHRTQPPPTVHYSRNMPPVDALMQEWPPAFEDLLSQCSAPDADLDCDLKTYTDIICALLDIPMYKSRVQSLHLLFTLYSAFKNSQHFGSVNRARSQTTDADRCTDAE